MNVHNSLAQRAKSFESKLLIFILMLEACSSMRPQSKSVFSPEEITFSVLDSVLLMEPAIIPELIEGITDDAMAIVGLENPLSSTIGEEFWLKKNRKGIINAFLVDFYLSREGIEIPAEAEFLPKDDKAFLWDCYAIYPHSIIAKSDSNGEIIYAPLSKLDLKRIQLQYRRFWKQNKDLPLETIRKNFRESGGILKYPYVWI